MSFRRYFSFVFLTLMLLFYPGGHIFFQIIAYNKPEFLKNTLTIVPPIGSVPYIDPDTQSPVATAQGVFIADAETLTPLFELQARTPFYPASTTKIVTALVAADIYKPDDLITVHVATSEGQLMGLVEGERMTAENLLYGLLVHSGNDAAYAIATDRGIDQFIGLMNEKAAAIGMRQTHFTNPAGFDDPLQLTTPYDLALAGRALLASPLLKKIVATKEITISDADFKYFHRLTNVNKLLGEIRGLGGLKTGYTEAAGENLVSFYRHENHDFIIVVMKSEDRFSDTTTLVNWIDANVRYTAER